MSRALIAAGDLLERTGRRLRRRGQRRSIQRRVTLADLEQDGWTSVAPGFVLSTGRAGTRLLTELLDASEGVAAHHVPRPELVRSSRVAFESIDSRPDIFDELVKAAREELIVDDARRGCEFVETNNRITFLAPAAARVFPRSRFLHIVRHPADIVRSGIRRGWYAGHEHDIGRIVPPAGDPAADGWAERDPIWRIGWMWNATCAFVQRLLAQLPADRRMELHAEELFSDPDAAAAAIRFLGGTPPARSLIESRLQVPVNAQSDGSFPRLAEWSDEQRALLRDAAPLAGEYGYSI